ncbi:hypothetical protein [Cellulomonas composti]|uniref:hypothetical protein n=1 Tax=Cellulomonas composti TaxID=266130 RepID=UPI0011BE8D08|nr:hypothetical protein [Cellulomonas composti]
MTIVTGKPNLRAVRPDDEPPAPKKPLTLIEAAEADDHLAELKAMRQILARALSAPNCPPRDMAALSRRQLEIGREIDALVAAAEREADVNHGATEAEAWDESAI